MTPQELFNLLGPAVLLPIPRGEKGPRIPGWQKLTRADMTPEFLEKLNHGNNIGVLQGSPSGGLCSIDADSPEALEALLKLNPRFCTTLISYGMRGGNVWIRLRELHPRSSKITTVQGEPWGEWRADGNQTVIAGIHPSGCPYRRNGKEVIEVSFGEIRWPDGLILPWTASPQAEEKPEVGYPANDVGRAKRFVDRYCRDVKYVPERGIWFTWTGDRWKVDRDGAILRMAVSLSGEMLASAAKITGTSKADQQERVQAAEEALECGDRRNIQDFLELAKVDIRVLLPADKLDADPWLVAAQNAAIDLKTGTIRAFTRSDFTTRELSSIADPQADCPRWLQFMEEVLPDSEVRRFIQKACGYSLTGETREQVFFFLYGGGRNGKSKFIEAIESILGSYSTRAGKGIVAANGRGDYPKHEIAELAGVRLASATETAEGERMAEETIKDITGGDFLRGERKYEDGFRFKPVCKLWIYGNHKPTIRGTDSGIWRRVRLIPFEQTFEGDSEDRDLTAKLMTEYPGILKWLIEGCLRWQAEGLEPPKAVLQAVADYRAEEDILADFLEACVTEDPLLSATHGHVFKTYQSFCSANGVRFPLSSRVLAKRLKKRGWQDFVAGTGAKTWRGVGITDVSEQ